MQWAYCKIHDNYLTILVLLLEDVSQTHAAFCYHFNASLPYQEGRITPMREIDKTNKRPVQTSHGVIQYSTERHIHNVNIDFSVFVI